MDTEEALLVWAAMEFPDKLNIASVVRCDMVERAKVVAGHSGVLEVGFQR